MRRSKYGNKKVTAFGMKFDSKGEYARYLFLKDAEKQGNIINLQCQVAFKIDVNGQHICKYIADFTYLVNNVMIVEDFKGIETAIFRLKKKLMLAVLNIDVKVIKIHTEELKIKYLIY